MQTTKDDNEKHANARSESNKQCDALNNKQRTLTMPRLTNLMSAVASVRVSFIRVSTNLLILPDFSATSWRMASSCSSSVPVPERRTYEA